jgi:HAD superfamily hydrolase (TIGR01509 family)
VIYSALNTEPQVLPGVAALLAELERRDLAWAIATSSLAAQVTCSVEALGLPKPPVIVDGSGVRRAKPAPDLLLAAARALDRQPAECWYVGDATWDMLSANSAGMVAIGVTTGAATADDLVATGAVVVVADLDGVRALL